MSMTFIFELDARVSSRLRIAEKPSLQRSVAAFLAHSGDSWFWGMGLVAIWFLSGSFWKQWAVLMLATISALAALVMGLKFVFRRRRPQGEWGSIYRNTDPHSFPSGHAARAFLIAVLATGLGPSGLALALWGWAPLVSLARVAMGVHYISDVLAGSILGILLGLATWHFHDQILARLATLAGMALW